MSAAAHLTVLAADAPAAVPLDQVFWSEVIGTGLLTLLGCGVVANVVLARTLGNAGGWLLIAVGWGMAVLAGVFAAYRSGAHINPAVTIGLLSSGAAEYAPGVDVTPGATAVYLAAQFLGAFLGAVVCWLAYRRHFDEHPGEPAGAADKLGVFCTGPAIPAPAWNVVTEVIGTFVLVFVVLLFGQTPSGLGPLAVALLVVGIGASLGGPTGYAINPARDLGPRIAHAVLPIRGRGGSNWGYAWVPVVGPLVGGVLGGLLARLMT